MNRTLLFTGVRTQRLMKAALFGTLACVVPSLFPAGAKETGAAAKSALVWPAPPDEARIAFVQSITKPEDVGAKLSGLRRFSNWLSGAHEGSEALSRPFGLAVDEADNFCVADTAANAVCFFDQPARKWYRWDQIGGTPFVSPIAVAKKGKTLFVADASTTPAIIAFNLEGKLLFKITDHLLRPVGLAIAGNHLIVADSAAHCVVSFDLNGKYLSKFGVRGAGPGEFNYPTHVAVNTQGDIFVTDSLNNRVQVFDSRGGFKRQIGKPGDGPGSFGRPKGVALDSSGRAYVVDALADNFQIFDSESRLLLDVGHAGAEPGEFWLPSGIAIGKNNRIYVADCYNGRIQVFQFVGKQ